MANTPVWKLRAIDLRRAIVQSLPNKHVAGTIYDTPAGLYALPKQDGVFPEIFRRGEAYGTEELVRLKRLVTPQSQVLFVGSHVGTLVIPVAACVAGVTAVEANPDTYRYLCANLALNGVTNVRTVQIAAGERQGSIEFLANNANTGGSKRMPELVEPGYVYDKPATLSVEMDRLDTVLTGEQFDLIVMDIEGSEYFALQGMPDLLRSARVLVVEFLSHHLRNVGQATTDQFLAAIGQDFRHLYIPSKHRIVQGADIAPTLAAMYAHDEDDDGLIFSKEPLPAI